MTTLELSDGRAIPSVGFGTWRLSDETAERAVSDALAVGYRHIDTAKIYGNETGVGRAIAASGMPRDEVFVTTKLWNDSHAPEAARAAIESSLELLGLDRVDLYLIHWPTPERGDHVSAWESLLEFRDEGLATSVGVSNFTAAHLDDLVVATGIPPVVNQIELHPTFIQTSMRAKHETLRVVTESWSPIGQSKDLAEPAIVSIAEELGRTPAQVVLRWHLQQDLVAIPKTVRPERMAENFDLFDFELSDEQMDAVSALDRGNRLGPDPETFLG